MIHMSVQQKNEEAPWHIRHFFLYCSLFAICARFTNGQPYITDEGDGLQLWGATFQQILMVGLPASTMQVKSLASYSACALLPLVNATGALETGINVPAEA